MSLVLLVVTLCTLLLPREVSAWWGAPPKKTTLEIYGPWLIWGGVILAFLTGISVAVYLVIQARRGQCAVDASKDTE